MVFLVAGNAIFPGFSKSSRIDSEWTNQRSPTRIANKIMIQREPHFSVGVVDYNSNSDCVTVMVIIILSSIVWTLLLHSN